MDLVFDHYTGFEGEPEIIFKSADGQYIADLWDGCFFFIIENATPNEQGWWESLALLYHTHTGWYASSPFELTEVDEAVIQLRKCFSISWEANKLQAYNDLVSVFEYASENRLSVFIEYS